MIIMSETTEVTETKEVAESNETKDAVLMVGTKSPAKSLAAAIQATIKNHGYAELRCIGDGAIGSAFRAAIIASGPLKQIGIDLVTIGHYENTIISDKEKTVTVMICEPR